MTETRPVVGWGGVPGGDSRRGLPLTALRATNRPQGWDTVKRTPPPSPISPLSVSLFFSQSLCPVLSQGYTAKATYRE